MYGSSGSFIYNKKYPFCVILIIAVSISFRYTLYEIQGE